jgi:hypothetical protein
MDGLEADGVGATGAGCGGVGAAGAGRAGVGALATRVLNVSTCDTWKAGAPLIFARTSISAVAISCADP